MAFGMSPFPMQFGTRGGGAAGDPTAITPENADAFFTSLGLTQAGTGTTWGETGQAATPLYAVDAAKVPLACETIGGKKYFGPIVNPAGTNLALHGADATTSAWSKSNCTAALQLGSLKQSPPDEAKRNIAFYTSDFSNSYWSKLLISVGSKVSDPFGGQKADRVTSSSTVAPQISRNALSNAAGTYTQSIYAKFNTSPVVAIYSSDGGSSYSAAWFNVQTGAVLSSTSVGAFFSEQSASIVDVGGGWYRLVLTFTKGATVNSTLGAIHSSNGSGSLTGVIGQIVDVYGVQIEAASAASVYQDITELHTLLAATANNATCLQAITSSSNPRVTKIWLARESGSGTVSITQDNGSTWADVTLTSDPQPFSIAAATLANPTLGIRIATSGDSVRLYGTQHQVVAHLLRPYIGPTAGSSVTTGARSLARSITKPDEIDIELVVNIPTYTSNNSLFVLHTGANFTPGLALYMTSATNLRSAPFGASDDTAINVTVTAGAIVKLHLIVSPSTHSLQLNLDTPATSVGRLPTTGLDRLKIGCDYLSASQAASPIIALRDNNGQLLGTPGAGFNIAAITALLTF